MSFKNYYAMKKFLTIAFSIFLLTSTDINAQVFNRETIKCLGTELDGSVTLRVHGYGRNRADAKEQAMKNAVWAIVFNGVRDGVHGSPLRPIVTEVNAQERYADYFNIFFADNGEYKKYISLRDTKKFSAGRSKDKLGYDYYLTIRVLRSELKKRLQDDNVID